MSGDRGTTWLLGRLMLTSMLDGTRPAGLLGAGHWAAGRRQRALAAWTGAAGFGLVAWGLATEAPTPGDKQKNIEQHKDQWRKQGLEVPATAATPASAARSHHALSVVASCTQVFFGVRSGLRHPRRLTVPAIASEILPTAFYVLRVPLAVRRRRPRIAAGSALVVAGTVARLRAASAEPLR